MERPTFDDYRRVLREQGIEPTDDELRNLDDHLRSFARLIVDLYKEEQDREQPLSHAD
jgi:hypothetical protein